MPPPAAGPVGAHPARPLPPVGLRVPTHEDAFAWHRLFADPEVMEFHGGAPAELSVYEELTARQRRHDAEFGFCLWTVLDGPGPAAPGAEGDAGVPVGFTGAQPWPQAWGPRGEIEIGWRLARPHWGRGLVTAAALATLDRLRAAGVREVVAMVDARNARSAAVTRRLGMRLAETYTSPVSRREAHCFRLAL
ncbi:GNAT family N-acetyltransferase [Streptomyces sp. NPDC050560]|uniref:GNAT family N-acetyltransferase n=1 Tax=Streptomyces sp. NPDC050560 TaxID=3365630 RepID=UPI00379E0F42